MDGRGARSPARWRRGHARPVRTSTTPRSGSLRRPARSSHVGLIVPIVAVALLLSLLLWALPVPSPLTRGSGSGLRPLAPPLQVDLVVSASSGPAPLEINVSASASGGAPPYSLNLCLGIGTCESAATWNGSPWSESDVVYTAPGNYTVTAKVADATGVTSLASSGVSVTLARPLAATLLPVPARGTVPFTVEFAALVSGGTAPYDLVWNFGDGHHAESHGLGGVNWTYNATGTFSPTVTITDSRGTTFSEALNPITVTAPAPAEQVEVGTVAVPYWVMATVVTVALAAVIGSTYIVYERRLRQESLALVQALWEEQTVPPEEDHR